ncbi:MAG: outer membrane lipoprotein-sorting protein [bacterium]
MHKNIIFVVLAFLLANISSLSAQADIDQVIEKIDQLYRSNTSRGEVEMEIITPHWQRTLRMDMWTYKMEKTFIRITSPAREEGFATLRIDDEMWNYLPQTDQVMKIPPSMMMGSWMGSDFTNDDIVRESSLFEDYDYQFTEVENPQPENLYIKLIPHEDAPVVWSEIIMAVRESDYLPVWEKFYGENHELARTMCFRDIETVGGKTIPTEMELIPENEEGQKTVVRYLHIEFNVDIDEDIFSLRNLQSQQ